MRSNRTACLAIIGGLVSGFLFLGAGCKREASPQVVQDPLGPIRCFQIADSRQLAEQSAVELCTAALSEAPGLCYAGALDRFHELSTQKILQLCNRATSTEPLECYAHLDSLGQLTEDQIIAYCATSCALGPPPPEASHPACLAAATTQTDLSLQSAGELCLLSSSAGPVRCFLAGQDLHKIADSTLVTLCAESRRCQYYNAPPVY